MTKCRYISGVPAAVPARVPAAGPVDYGGPKMLVGSTD
jgi:hypothetical protein